MKKRIAMWLKYGIGLGIIGIVACIFYISSADAKVCFLPGGLCDSEADASPTEPKRVEKGCVLGSPMPGFVCEQCEDGRYKCSGCKEDYIMVRGECVCDGEECGSKRDNYCPNEFKNSCGLCKKGKCKCKGTKCSSTQKCEGGTNACGNCKGTCVDQNKCPQGWSETKPAGCFDEAKTPDGSKLCYKERECKCAEDSSKCTCADRGWKSDSQCSGGKIAVKKDIINGVQCYLCSDKKCSFYGENYFDSESSCTSCEKAKPVDAAKVGGLVCYECPKVTACADLNLADFKNDTCFNTNKEDSKCKNYIGHSCWQNTNAKGCSERGLSDSKDTECFNTNKENKECEKTCWENTNPKSCSERGLSMGKDDVCFKKHTEDKKCADPCWKNENPKSCEERGSGFYTKAADCQAKCTNGTCIEDKTCGENHACFVCGAKKQTCQNADAKTCKCGTTVSAEGCTICKTDCKCSDYGAYQSESTCADNCKQAKSVEAKKVGGLTCYHCNDNKVCKDFDPKYKSSCTCNQGQLVSMPVDKSKVCNLTCYSECICGWGGEVPSVTPTFTPDSSGDTDSSGNPKSGEANLCEKCCAIEIKASGSHIVKTYMADSVSECRGFTCGTNCCSFGSFAGTNDCYSGSGMGVSGGFSDAFSDAFSDGISDSISNGSMPKLTAEKCGNRNCEAEYPGQKRHCCMAMSCHTEGKTTVCTDVNYLCIKSGDPCPDGIVDTEHMTSEVEND